jgi:AmiR/NasT family two-component response regulator
VAAKAMAVPAGRVMPAAPASSPAVVIERLLGTVTALQAQNEQLQQALDSRIAIEQAKGILAERYRLSVDDAFALLRRAARSNRLKLHAVAADVVASRETPAVIRDLVAA